MIDDEELPKGYTCPHCKKFNEFDMYTYAHWNDHLTHVCICKNTNNILGGEVIDEEDIIE